MRHSIQPFVAQVGLSACPAQAGPYQCVVLLLDDAVIVLAVGSAPTQLQANDLLTPEADHMVIEELAAVIRMQLHDGER